MGIDICIYAEKFIDGKWVCINKKIKHPYYDVNDIDSINLSEYIHDEFHICNRNFFSVVSYTSSYLSSPEIYKGLPADISESLKYTYAGFTECSPSWIIWYEAILFCKHVENLPENKNERPGFFWKATSFNEIEKMIGKNMPEDPRDLRLVYWWYK